MEIKIHFWPNTPDLRELKIYINGKLEISSFNNLKEIEGLLSVLKRAAKELKEIK